MSVILTVTYGHIKEKNQNSVTVQQHGRNYLTASRPVGGALTPAVLTILDNPAYCIRRRAPSQATSWQLKTMLPYNKMSALRARDERAGGERKMAREMRRGEGMHIKNLDHGLC